MHTVPCAVIIVTHNSEACLPQCLKALFDQSCPPSQIIVIDSASSDPSYLNPYSANPLVTLHLAKTNIGFCAANNLGLSYVDPRQAMFVLFLNPDAFLTPHFLEKAIDLLNTPQQHQVGALSGLLLGFDLLTHAPNGRIDSMGIFQSWYGKWYDRGQGKNYDASHSYHQEHVPALCGALILCRLEALHSVELGPSIVMDPTFFMYKEDIDLSLRLRKKGWSLLFAPHLIAYHCRGWQQDRSRVPRRLRLQSAKNEMRLHFRLKSPYLFYSFAKYVFVKLFDL